MKIILSIQTLILSGILSVSIYWNIKQDLKMKDLEKKQRILIRKENAGASIMMGLCDDVWGNR